MGKVKIIGHSLFCTCFYAHGKVLQAVPGRGSHPGLFSMGLAIMLRRWLPLLISGITHSTSCAPFFTRPRSREAFTSIALHFSSSSKTAGISNATTVSGACSGPTEETFLNLLLWRHGASYLRGSQDACSCEQGAPGSGRHGPQGVHYVDRMELLRSRQACSAPRAAATCASCRVTGRRG